MANGQFMVADIPGAVNRGLQFKQQQQLRPLQTEAAGLAIQGQKQGLQQGAQNLAVGQQGIETEQQRVKSQNLFNTVSRLRSLPDDQKLSFVQQNITEVEGRGGDATESKQALALIQQGNFAELGQNLDSLHKVGVETGFLKAGSSATTNIGTVSPKDFTVESIGNYEQSGNIQDLERFSPKIVKVAGVNHQLNPETQKWEPIIDATTKNVTTQAKAIANLEADKQSRIDFAESKTKWQTGKPKFQSKIASAEASQDILNATADQIKKRINVWTTTYGASLSGLPGSEARELKNLFNTLKAHSAFSTLTDLKASGGTLGAISEAELVLLEAKLGALDQRGEATEILRVVDQIAGANLSSISRLEKEFDNTSKMFQGSFDDFQASQSQKPVGPMSDDELFN